MLGVRPLLLLMQRAARPLAGWARSPGRPPHGAPAQPPDSRVLRTAQRRLMRGAVLAAAVLRLGPAGRLAGPAGRCRRGILRPSPGECVPPALLMRRVPLMRVPRAAPPDAPPRVLPPAPRGGFCGGARS